MNKTLLFGAIASVLTLNAFAETTTSTVTSRNYVDARDALKQNKIPAAGTNASTPGETVVTYTETGNGTIGERGIFDWGTGWDRQNNELVSDHGTDLLEAGNIIPDLVDLYDSVTEISNTVNNLPEKTVTYKTCTEWSGTPHTDANCLLWNLSDSTVYGSECETNADCHCECGGSAQCNYHRCDYNFCDGCV
ncbi:MAG: hypothetical protein J5620_01945 [Alphaproteobacteria bacterium]|nr:hypothetical protein [Alphaproteobacteria bacterium]